MAELRYRNVVAGLKSAVPEFFMSGEQFYEDLPHDVLGTFAQVLCRWLRSKEERAAVLRAVCFIEAMAESPDDEVVNLLIVSVFEVVCDDDACCVELSRMLTPRARRMLDHACACGL